MTNNNSNETDIRMTAALLRLRAEAAWAASDLVTYHGEDPIALAQELAEAAQDMSPSALAQELRGDTEGI